MVVDTAGNAYVGNFGFDFYAGAEFREADLALVRPDGSVEVAARGLKFPNGSVITPDGTTLIVGESLGGSYQAFDIRADATLGPARQWAHVDGAAPDGCTLDADGVQFLVTAKLRPMGIAADALDADPSSFGLPDAPPVAPAVERPVLAVPVAHPSVRVGAAAVAPSPSIAPPAAPAPVAFGLKSCVVASCAAKARVASSAGRAAAPMAGTATVAAPTSPRRRARAACARAEAVAGRSPGFFEMHDMTSRRTGSETVAGRSGGCSLI